MGNEVESYAHGGGGMVDSGEAGVRGWEVEEGGGGGQRGSKTRVLFKKVEWA